jgi:hypothetical protein
MLPPSVRARFDELLADYRFAALKHHGREWASPIGVVGVFSSTDRNAASLASAPIDLVRAAGLEPAQRFRAEGF